MTTTERLAALDVLLALQEAVSIVRRISQENVLEVYGYDEYLGEAIDSYERLSRAYERSQFLTPPDPDQNGAKRIKWSTYPVKKRKKGGTTTYTHEPRYQRVR
jgi:hypothetical protein